MLQVLQNFDFSEGPTPLGVTYPHTSRASSTCLLIYKLSHLLRTSLVLLPIPVKISLHIFHDCLSFLFSKDEMLFPFSKLTSSCAPQPWHLQPILLIIHHTCIPLMLSHWSFPLLFFHLLITHLLFTHSRWLFAKTFNLGQLWKVLKHLSSILSPDQAPTLSSRAPRKLFPYLYF